MTGDSTLPRFTTRAELEAAEALERHVEAILNAAGTSLKHYTLPGNRARIINAVSLAMNEAFFAGLDEGRVTLAHVDLKD